MVKKYCMLSADKGERLLGFIYEGCHYLLTFQKHTTACRQTGTLLSIGGKVKTYWKPNFTSFPLKKGNFLSGPHYKSTAAFASKHHTHHVWWVLK
jgi:hypothetical protein